MVKYLEWSSLGNSPTLGLNGKLTEFIPDGSTIVNSDMVCPGRRNFTVWAVFCRPIETY